MDYALALAFAAVTNSLCLFTGAGFTKAMSPGAPGWLDMLDMACENLKNPKEAKEQLAKARELGLPLEDCAQALELLFRREEMSLRKIISEQIGAIKVDPVASKSCADFLKENFNVAVVTTNYDNLLQQIVTDSAVALNYPGKPLSARVNSVHAYHIHGHMGSTPFPRTV